MGAAKSLIHVTPRMVPLPGMPVRKRIARAAETAYFERSSGMRRAAGVWAGTSRHDMATSGQPILTKRYGGERLYRPALGSYVTIGDLAGMVEDKEEFVVREAKTGEDITATILRAIIRKRAPHG